MPYAEVPLAPGVVTEEHPTLAKPRWQYTNLARFYRGWPQPIGGRQKIGSLNGLARGSFSWSANDGRTYGAFGTTTKLYVYFRAFVYDITPLRNTTTIGIGNAVTGAAGHTLTVTDAGHGATTGDTVYFKGNQSIGGVQWGGGAGNLTAPFTTTAASTFVTVAHTAHGLTTGEIVTYSGASPVGGITPSGDYTVRVIDANSYEIECSSAAGTSATGGGTVAYLYHRHWIVTVTSVNVYTVTTSSATTAASNAGTFTAEYELNIGNTSGSEIATGATGGFGGGFYGLGSQGALISHSAQNYPRIWTFAAWGQNLSACPFQGSPLEWALNCSTRAAAISGVPAGGVGSIFVSPYRQMFLVGCSDGVSYVPTRINYSDQEDNTVYTPSPTVLAGVFVLSQGSIAMRGMVTDRGMLIWTDKSVYPVSYQGDPNAPYSLGDPLATGVGLLGPNAIASMEGNIIWAGNNGNFYKYDGSPPSILKCDIRGDVLFNMAPLQDFKAWMGTDKQYNEFWFGWQSQSSSTLEIDRYCIYSETEGWAPGSRNWTTWLDRQELSTVVSVDASGNLYAEDIGTSDNGSPFIATAITYAFDFGAGHPKMEIRGYIPVFSKLAVGVNFSILPQEYPMSAVTTDGPYAIIPGQTTQDLRSEGRVAACKWQSVSDANCFWRPNGFWLDLGPGGSR